MTNIIVIHECYPTRNADVLRDCGDDITFTKEIIFKSFARATRYCELVNSNINHDLNGYLDVREECYIRGLRG